MAGCKNHTWFVLGQNICCPVYALLLYSYPCCLNSGSWNPEHAILHQIVILRIKAYLSGYFDVVSCCSLKSDGNWGNGVQCSAAVLNI